MLPDDPLEGMWKRGLAMGNSVLRTDTMRFRYRDEVFEFPCILVIPDIAVYNGYFYTAPVKRLRELQGKA